MAPAKTYPFWLNCLALAAAGLAIAAVTWKNSQASAPVALLNVSYEPTRELFRDLNPLFVKIYETGAGVHLAITQSHGASSKQVQALVGGLDADVVTLPLPSDVNTLQRKGLIGAGWASRLPDNAHPFTSTIVFVVRKGNPKAVRDWTDLVRKNVTVLISDPKTSGEGKLSVLAAWGSVVRRSGSDASASHYLRELYAHVPAVDSGTTPSALESVCDVRLASENEALLAIRQHPGAYDIVYPPVSIRAEPSVAWVDSVVARHHSEASAKAYAQFLFTAPAQQIIAQHGYRPADPAVLSKYAKQFPAMDLFPVSLVAQDWDAADRKFFAEGAIFDQIHPVAVALTSQK
jgi:sulfate/thiosulfate-binding protein